MIDFLHSTLARGPNDMRLKMQGHWSHQFLPQMNGLNPGKKIMKPTWELLGISLLNNTAKGLPKYIFFFSSRKLM